MLRCRLAQCSVDAESGLWKWNHDTRSVLIVLSVIQNEILHPGAWLSGPVGDGGPSTLG